MKDKLTYWLLARFPRPMVVILVGLADLTLQGVVLGIFMVIIPIYLGAVALWQFFGLPLLALKGSPAEKIIVWMVAFFIGFVLEALIISIPMGIEWIYKRYDRHVPQREKKS